MKKGKEEGDRGEHGEGSSGRIVRVLDRGEEKKEKKKGNDPKGRSIGRETEVGFGRTGEERRYSESRSFEQVASR